TGGRDWHGPGPFDATNQRRPWPVRSLGVERRSQPAGRPVSMSNALRQEWNQIPAGPSVVVAVVPVNVLAGRLGRALLLELLHALPDELALELRQVLDEGLSLEVIDLVLEDVREPALGGELALGPGAVLVAHADLPEPRRLLPLVGYRETALLETDRL